MNKQKFIDEELQRLEQLKLQEKEKRIKDESKDFVKELEKDMAGSTFMKFLTPYQAMLHARKMEKKLNVDSSIFVTKISQNKDSIGDSALRSPVSSD